MSMFEDHFTICMMAKTIREMKKENQLGGDYALPTDFKRLWKKRKKIFKPVSDGR